MLFPIKHKYKLTAEFWQSRPLSLPYEKRTHPHAAWDAACHIGIPIIAPENGMVAYLIAIRADRTRTMSEIVIDPQPFDFHGHHYFYDTYGGVIVLLGESHYTHVITHSYANQLYNHCPVDAPWTYVESEYHERWPLMVWHTFGDLVRVRAGQLIGAVGNAGYSTGPHIHYEIHRGREHQRPLDRLDPADVYPQEWEAHRDDRRVYDWEQERERWKGR